MSSYLSSLLWGASQLDDAVDKATSELLPSGAEDIALNLEICDQIRSKSVPPKDAMRTLKRRLNHKNPNVQLLALGLTDVCIKNGGDQFLVEIASREFMDNLVSILKMPVLNHDVKNKILRLTQDWATAFEGKPTLSYVGEVYKTLQREGFNFPPRDPAVTSSAMVDTQTAPEWIDSDVCLRCRTPFTFTNRKHHCRNCGQVFDQQCSSKSMALPHFGIMQEVRVCDSCFTKLNRKSTKIHRPSQSMSSSRHRSARDLADAELQRAIQLSLEEVGAAGGRRPGYVPSPSPWQSSEPPIVDHMTHPYASSSRSEEEEEDPDLKAAIEASLREANAPKASAPVVIEPSPDRSSSAYVSAPGYPQSYPPSSATPKPRLPVIPNYDLEPLEADAILTFNQTVDQVQAQGGKDIARYPAVTELFDKANSLRPKLAMNLSDTGRKEQLLSEMHDKLSQAVKLYDQLLTEQVSHPPWRSASVAASTSYQQVNPTYAARYQTVDGSYNQWSPEVQSQHPTSPVIQGQMQAVQSYYAASQQANGPYVTSPVVESYHQPIYQPQQVSIPPSRYPTDIQQQYSPESTQYAMTSPPPVTVPRYNAAPAAPQPAAIHLSSITPAPVSLPTASIPPPPQSQPQPQPQPQVAQSPPPVLSQHTSSPSLTRHSTISSHTVSPAAANAYLSRHNTVSHSPQQFQQVVVPTPNFPAVPTSIPQTYASYGAPVETERKEALLIDL